MSMAFPYVRQPIGRDWVAGRTVIDRKPIHVHDLLTAGEDLSRGREIAALAGHRTTLGIPLLREGAAIGCMVLRRVVVDPFAEKQITILQTFADQAVIAIENTRLFEAEQASKRELQESLEYQTATSDVLNVISRSPNELQPVLDAIVATAGRLCEADYAHFRLERDGLYHVVARHALNPAEIKNVPGLPVAADRTSVSGKVASEGRTIHVPDVLADPEDTYAFNAGVPARTMLGVPLLRHGNVIGIIVLFRKAVAPFTERQIELVTTFADQAVIAIENTRLFEAEQASKRELQVSLEQQTATADVLKVISRSALDLQRVLDALVESVARLCNAYDASIYQVFGDGLRLVAHYGQIPTSGPVGQFTFPLVRRLIMGRSVIDRRTIHVEDVLAEADEYPEARQRALQLGFRTVLAVPLIRAGEAIGVIAIRRADVRPFSDRQIELLKTFADQAVIAIENTRLFEAEQASKRELARSVEELESLGKVSQAVLEHGDAEQCARAGRIREFDGGWLAVEISLLCFDVSNVLHLVRSGDTCKGCRRQRHGCALVRGRTASRTWPAAPQGYRAGFRGGAGGVPAGHGHRQATVGKAVGAARCRQPRPLMA